MRRCLWKVASGGTAKVGTKYEENKCYLFMYLYRNLEEIGRIYRHLLLRNWTTIIEGEFLSKELVFCCL